MSNYLQLFETFHKDRLSFLSQKKKTQKCSSCENKKKFLINENSLIYSCGSENNKCGPQFKLTLPEYIHFTELMQLLHENKHGSIDYNPDPSDLSVYNLDDLSKVFKIEKDLQEQKEMDKIIDNDIQKMTASFIETNHFQSHYELIDEYNDLKMKNDLQKNKLKKQLENETLSTIQRVSLRKDYAKLILYAKRDLLPMYEKIKSFRSNLYLMMKDPVVEEHFETYLSKKVKSKSKDIGPELLKKIIDHFKKNQGIMVQSDYEKLTEVGDKIPWGETMFIGLRSKIKSIQKELKILGPLIQKPISNDKIELSKHWKSYLLEHKPLSSFMLKSKKIDSKKEKPKKEEPPKKKGLGDELEDLQVEIMEGVSAAEQKKKSK